MTQTERILKYMQETGAITQLDAMEEFGCMRLGARIYDLRKEGHKIAKQTVTGKNRYGETVSFAKYILEEAKDEKELNA